MDEVALAQVQKAMGQLGEVDARLVFSLGSLFSNHLHEVATRAVFEHQINMPLCGLHLVQAHDVRVLRGLKNADFGLEILLQLAIQPCSDYGLDSDDALAGHMLPTVD